MEWTMTKPTAPGWYWFKRAGWITTECVFCNGHGRVVGIERPIQNLSDWPSGEWAGPLEVPHG